MNTRAMLTVFVAFICCLTVHAQDVATMSDADFFSYMEQCKKKGNDCYVTSGNKYELKRIIDEYQGAIERRSAAGTLDAGKRAELMQGVNKLWGDYYYLDGEEHPKSYAEAERYFRGCITFAKNHHEYQDANHDLYILPQELAQLYYKQKRYAEAYEEMNKAYFNANKYVSPDSLDPYLDIQSQLAICLARTAIDEQGFKAAKELMDEVIGAYQGTDTERYGEALRKKAKILMLQEESGSKMNRAEALKCYQYYFELKKADALANFLGMNSETREQYWSRVRPFVTDCYRLEDTDAGFLYDVTLFAKGLLLQLDSAGAGRQQIHATWQMIQSRLKPDACAIEFIQYEKYGQQQMGALVLKKTGKPMFVKMASPDSVMQYKIQIKGEGEPVQKLICAVHGADSESRHLRNSLYGDSLGFNSYLWNAHLITAINKVREIWFSPDGYVHQLAIEYLLPKQMTDVTCHRLSSTRRLLEKASGVQSQRALIVGGVNYQKASGTLQTGNDTLAFNFLRNLGRIGFQYLDNSLKEAEGIMQSRNNGQDSLLIADRATETDFMQCCNQFPIIHISTHGYFGASSVPQGTDLKPCAADMSLSESLLAMSGIQHHLRDDSFNGNHHDGILSARELSSLDMSQTALVVLSCCETGLGYVTADGVYGIQRGLKNAGVQAIICTLWDIDDLASCYFMSNFHKFLSEGHTITQAFYDARREMKDYTADDRDSHLVFNPATMALEVDADDIGADFSEPSYRDAFILIDALE